MKKNFSLRLAMVLLIVTVLTTCIVGGTFAAYSSSISGSATAAVAQWVFKADETAYSSASTSSLSYTLSGSGAGNTIVPGIDDGTFSIYIDASGSDVGVDYIIDFTALPSYITFHLTDDTGDTIAANQRITGSIAQADTMQVKVDIYWEAADWTSAPEATNVTFTISGSQNVSATDVAAAVVADSPG